MAGQLGITVGSIDVNANSSYDMAIGNASYMIFKNGNYRLFASSGYGADSIVQIGFAHPYFAINKTSGADICVTHIPNLTWRVTNNTSSKVTINYIILG